MSNWRKNYRRSEAARLHNLGLSISDAEAIAWQDCGGKHDGGNLPKWRQGGGRRDPKSGHIIYS